MKMPNASLGDIYDRMNDPTQTPKTHPASASLFTDWSLEAGDVVNISQGDDTYSVPVYVNKVKWQGAPVVEIESTGNKEREPIAKASRQASGGGGGIEKTKGVLQTVGEQIASLLPSVCVISEDIVVMKGTLLAHDAQFSTISASMVSIEGQLTASAIAAKLTDAQVVHVGGALQVDGDSDFTGGVEFNNQVIFQEKLTALGTLALGDTDMGGAYVGTPTASASGSTITLFFTTAAGSTVSVNFNKPGGTVTDIRATGSLYGTHYDQTYGVWYANLPVRAYLDDGSTFDDDIQQINVGDAYNKGFDDGEGQFTQYGGVYSRDPTWATTRMYRWTGSGAPPTGMVDMGTGWYHTTYLGVGYFKN